MVHAKKEWYVFNVSDTQSGIESIGRLIAESDIRKILALYPQYADDGMGDKVSELFSSDGKVTFGDTSIEGREAIAAWIESTQAAPIRHLMVNTYVNVTSADTAEGSLDMLLLAKEGDSWVPRTSARYQDRFVRNADGWRFAERVLTIR